MSPVIKFESFVNSERCKTVPSFPTILRSLRVLLIQKDVKQVFRLMYTTQMFESFVNSERCKTTRRNSSYVICLRVLLIQKDVKRLYSKQICITCLRVLLIQKDVKQKQKEFVEMIV